MGARCGGTERVKGAIRLSTTGDVEAPEVWGEVKLPTATHVSGPGVGQQHTRGGGPLVDLLSRISGGELLVCKYAHG